MNYPTTQTLKSNLLGRLGWPKRSTVHNGTPAAAQTALGLLQGIQGGSVRVSLPNGETHVLGHGDLHAAMVVTDWAVFERVLGEGDIGFAESFIDGLWDTDNLAALLTLFAANRNQLARAVHGRWLAVLGHRLRHLARANTRSGSRRNILAHYDLGNSFYRRWLDDTMTYSAALFGNAELSLEQAQQAKYLRILDRLDPKPGDTILEVGCGWGGFAEMATTRYGCKVHGITLSPSQLAFAQERARVGGWTDQAEFELIDYRDVRGRYDHIVSIEMIEAVGERYWKRYFKQLKQCLKPGGRVMIQAITISDERFPAYRRGTDFIQRHIFPGGMLLSPKVFSQRAKSADFRVADRFAFGIDYARTLALWHEKFDAEWSQIEGQDGFDVRFRQLWKFYLAYCEAGFRAGATDVYHFMLEPTK